MPDSHVPFDRRTSAAPPIPSKPGGRHRGPHPGDQRLFSRVAVASLRVAAEEHAWLLGRGYGPSAALELVASHHQLETRQRMALMRAVCSDAVRAERARRLVPMTMLAGETVHVDGLNVVVTLEVALSGGVLLRGRDDVLRDLAGVRRNYHPVVETPRAVEFVAAALRAARLRAVKVFIDSEVSNAGRLRDRFEACARHFGCSVSIDLVPNADRALVEHRSVVSSDAAVLDRATTWVNLTRAVVAHALHDAWIVDLG